MNRREYLKFMAAVCATGVASSSLPLRSIYGQEAGKQSRLLWVFLNGGYAPIQTSAMSFINNEENVRFGCNAEKYRSSG